MSTITRGWVAFAAVGAALIHLALVVGSPPLFATAFAVIGAAELAWGVAAMASSRLPLPRVAFAGAMAPPLLWSAVLLADVTLGVAAPLSFVPLLLASALGFFAAAAIGVQLRRAATDTGTGAGTDPRPGPGAAAYLVGLFAGALVVASITTPALAATEAGRFAQPHGEHSEPFINLEHGDHP